MSDSAAEETSNPFRRFLEAQRRGGPLLVWALIVGSVAGLVGGVFRLSVTTMAGALAGAGDALTASGLPGWAAPVVFAAVFVGLAVWLVQRFAPEAAGSGVQEIEGSLDGLRPLRWQRVLPVKFLGGVLSLGAGMVLGREGPTVQMGGAVGRMLGDWFRRDEQEVHVLVAAGAGAGLAAAFNAPLAGMLFVIEEMRPQFHYNVVSVQSVLIACAAADIVVRLILGGAVAIPMAPLPDPSIAGLSLFAVLGVLFGLFGVAFNTALVLLLDVFDRIPNHRRWLAGVAVGAGVGFLGWWNPDLVGGGYQAIQDSLAGRIAAGGLLALCLARFATTLVCFSSGAPGGIFAPMLALGTLLGLAVGDFAGSSLPWASQSAEIFVVAGMGALFSATVRAPITGIVLAVELTGNFGQILPVTIACVVATIVAHRLGGQPIYTMLLERTLQREAVQREAG